MTRRKRLTLLLVLVALAGVANVPFAVTRLHSRTQPKPRGENYMGDDAARREWPAATPHTRRWPAPHQFEYAHEFGFHYYNVFGEQSGQRFQMNVQLTGWPLPVLEDKKMWWDWSDPTLKGPEPDPALRVVPSGLILNPIIVGVGLYLILTLPRDVFVFFRARRRRKRGRCIGCGYSLTGNTSGRCPECGRPIAAPAPDDRAAEHAAFQ
ncbi:MAG: hypothetical protein D6744_11205 [Planctomycetota bacterium]|nr:MAG: hypothetical protein D6744_11205 [Planctomycetota bacterium]